VLAVRQLWIVESGASLPAPENCVESVGAKETRIERQLDMSEKGTTRKNSVSTKPRMKDGEEPTEVLLGLVSSPLLTLKARGVAKVLTAKGANGQTVVVAVFDYATWDQTVGIVPATLLPTVPTVKG
jgi:hypothetical protein